MPGEIKIHRRELTVLRHVLMAAQPQEGCALLLGDALLPPAAVPRRLSSATEPTRGGSEAPEIGAGIDAADLEIRLIWPCLNVWEPAAEQTRRFRLDPREQLLAQRWGRQRGLRVLGSAHSHPRSPALPSATDLALAVAPTLLVILSPLDDWEPAGWWLEATGDDQALPRPLRWRMVD